MTQVWALYITPESRAAGLALYDFAAVDDDRLNAARTLEPRKSGGRRRVLAVISNRRTAEEVQGNLGRLPPRAQPPRAQSPPQLSLAV